VKDHLASLVGDAPTPTQGQNVAREYLQARILEALQRARAMMPLAFHGGTALRFLYAIPRYSEDLDFALERSTTQYDIRAYLKEIRKALDTEGYAVEVTLSDRKVIHSGFLRFHGLPFELGLSPHEDQVLAVKIEVDTNPPAGAGLATTVVRRHVILHLQHHDQASLLAGKLHAILQRPYLEGRDVYDLLWFLSDVDWPAPNLTMLNNALQQTGWEGPSLTERNWSAVVLDRLQSASWHRVVDDVRPFLEPRADLSILSYKSLMQVLERR
jgi:predicted nucleotidyltransferase component of viral defense system